MINAIFIIFNNKGEIEKRMKKLKATLYAKFGNSINLEEWVLLFML